MTTRDLSLTQALLRCHIQPADEDPRDSSGPITITISREAGALGNSLANELGQRLGWPVYDHALLDRVAEELHKPVKGLEEVDERPVSWLTESLEDLFLKYRVSSNAYLKGMFRVVRGLGEKGRCILVGRGANFLLPIATTLRVRLVAQTKDREKVVAQRSGLSASQSAAWVEKTERERTAFLTQTFGHDPADPHLYDLVLNMSRLNVRQAADVVLEAMKRFSERGPAGTQRDRPLSKPAATH